MQHLYSLPNISCLGSYVNTAKQATKKIRSQKEPMYICCDKWTNLDFTQGNQVQYLINKRCVKNDFQSKTFLIFFYRGFSIFIFRAILLRNYVALFVSNLDPKNYVSLFFCQIYFS